MKDLCEIAVVLKDVDLSDRIVFGMFERNDATLTGGGIKSALGLCRDDSHSPSMVCFSALPLLGFLMVFGGMYA